MSGTLQAYPVLYQPNGDVIGSAATRAGALQVIGRKCSKLACEQWSATLAERLDGTLAWFASPVLRMRHPNRRANQERLERQSARVSAGYL